MSQTQGNSIPDLPAYLQAEYQALVRALKRRRGFGLLFVRCSPAEGEGLIAKVREDIPQKRIDVLRLEKSIDNLYEIIQSLPNKDELDILFITGIEKSLVDYIKPGIGGQGHYYKGDTVPRILGHLNLQRECFRDNFKICFVFLLPQFALKYFIRRAPDFFDWRSGVWEFPTSPRLVEEESSRIVLEGDFEEYRKLSPQERKQKIFDIQELLAEEYQTAERKAELFFEQGNILIAGNDWEEAITSFEKALQFNPDNDAAWYNRGIALKKLGRYEEALASYEKALKFKPDKDEAWNNRGLALRKLGRYEEALASYDQALKFKPDDDAAWNNRGLALRKLGRYEEALASYDQALKFKPDKDEAWNNRGLALVILGRYEEAVASYDQALKFKPDDDAAWYNRGNALVNLGRYKEAIASYEKALQFNPDNDSAWYNKACCYALQGNIDLAIENLEKAINLNPDKYPEMAKTDSDFDSIRQDPRFQTLINP